MVYALLVCSDEECAEEIEAWGTLDELEARACECGCALQLIAVSEVEFEEPQLFVLPLAA
ncbi:MAG: hypothetical protein QOH76_1818 [Thermoleophilaceae bacterium]|jgi:hypothetical protein|nr:hypothetical protein [Thermoleophilaceae bacterium]